MNKKIAMALAGTMVMALGAGTAAMAEDTVSIGATYYTLQTEFCMRMDNYATKYCEENGIDYVSYDGNNDAATQLDQVETMIANGVDAIILNPQDADACVACVEAADKAGIPVFGVNTMVNTDLLTAYVGSQDVGAGEEIMQYMIDYMKSDDFNIVIIEGPMGQSAQLQRWEGINNVLADYPDIEILAYNTANWSRSEAMTLMETWLTTYGDEIDAVVAENDEMALGAVEAVDSAGKTGDILITGQDANDDAVSALKEGKIYATSYGNPYMQGYMGVVAAVDTLNGGAKSDFYQVQTKVVTIDNADTFKD